MASEPITREEMLLNAVATGESTNLEPITREEMFLAKLGGADVTTPIPITRKEQFLQKAIQGGGSGGGGGDNFPIGDGNTHIWISLAEGRTSPMLGVGVNGTVTVDWGDGSEPDVLTGTNATALRYTPVHEYGKAGDYVITISGGQIGICAYATNTSGLLHDDVNKKQYAYLHAIQKIELGNNATHIEKNGFAGCGKLERVNISDGVTSIGDNAFFNCTGLKNVNIPNSVLSIGGSAFSACYSLESVNIPDGLTQIKGYTFSNCRSLKIVNVGGSVASIEQSAFGTCYSALCFDFSKHTSVPTLSATNAFSDMPSDCQFLVPASLYDEWKAATNWSTYASKIVGV